ncbi:MAG: alpha amylase C-terminal domain-containing protein, partial [Coriobacteriales bacterium]|nr:alpha amylase C-terminal domain-containing protein [Coriobacteriales bacterium]
DMGWMHDTLELFQTGPEYRSDNYHKLSFSMMYFGDEHYLLPLSHDEVVHGKATIAQKMWGDYELKFGQARALYLYMFAHPGKKLNFMGSEIAQLREWDEEREQDWFLRGYPQHDAFFRFCAELNKVYADNPALWEQDYQEAGFAWREVSAEKDVVYAFERVCDEQRLLCVLNLSDRTHTAYPISVPGTERAKDLLNSDWDRFGGATPEAAHSWCTVTDETLELDLPAFSGQLLVLE